MIVGALFLYLFTVFLIYIIVKFFLASFILLENALVSKILGLILGLIKGIILISYFFIIVIYYDYLENIYTFDKNSLFLEYFLKFSVQFNHVWNHWYS